MFDPFDLLPFKYDIIPKPEDYKENQPKVSEDLSSSLREAKQRGRRYLVKTQGPGHLAMVNKESLAREIASSYNENCNGKALVYRVDERS